MRFDRRSAILCRWQLLSVDFWIGDSVRDVACCARSNRVESWLLSHVTCLCRACLHVGRSGSAYTPRAHRVGGGIKRGPGLGLSRRSKMV